MNKNIEDIKKNAKKHSEILARLGKELFEIRFNYKVTGNTKTEYWQKRIDDFKKYHQKGTDYYTQVHLLMNIFNEKEAQLFLLNMSKMRQLGTRLMELLEKVKQNPSIMSPKDKQQSKWSKGLKEELIDCSNKNLEHEIHMNTVFRDFYEKHLKEHVG